MHQSSSASTSAVVIFCAALLAPHSASAYLLRYYFPTQLDGEIQVLNKSDQDLDLWIGHPTITNPQTGELIYEQIYRVMATSKRRFPLKNLRQHAFVQVKIHEEDQNSLIVRLRRPDGEIFEVGPGHSQNFSGRPSARLGSMLITNMSELSQKVQIKRMNVPGIDSAEFLELPGQGHLVIEENIFAKTIQVEGELPLFVAWTGKDDFELLSPKAPENFSSKPKGVRFVLADSTKQESFIVDLEDERLIAEARAQLSRPTDNQKTILFALPDFGSNGLNQNWIHPHRPAWSWHIRKVFQFGQFGSDSCNGTPSLVEDFLSQWITSERAICFRDYRVVQELP